MVEGWLNDGRTIVEVLDQLRGNVGKWTMQLKPFSKAVVTTEEKIFCRNGKKYVPLHSETNKTETMKKDTIINSVICRYHRSGTECHRRNTIDEIGQINCQGI